MIAWIKDLFNARNTQILFIKDITARHVKVGQGEVEAGEDCSVGLGLVLGDVIRRVIPLRDGVRKRLPLPLLGGQGPDIGGGRSLNIILGGSLTKSKLRTAGRFCCCGRPHVRK